MLHHTNMKKKKRVLHEALKNKVQCLYEFTLSVLAWILAHFKVQVSKPLSLLQPLIASLIKSTDRGPEGYVEYVKKVRTSLLLYLSGEYPEKRVEGIKLTSDGIPKAFGPLVPIIRSRLLGEIRLILTVLFASRGLKLGKEPDVKSIITHRGKRIEGDYSKHIRSFWSTLGYKQSNTVPRSVLFKQFHWTTKSGPNGQALYTSWNDLILLSDKQWDELTILGGNKVSLIREFVKSCQHIINLALPVTGKVKRKLSYFPDKEDKVRVIAIGDYMSQSVLKPLHDYLFKALKKIPQDCTFNQGSFKNLTQTWDHYICTDLTAATDRFPLEFEKMVLKGHFPDHYVEAWASTMVDTPFEFTDTKGKVHDLSYAVGNPMGFYSSWNSFALSHHYLVYYCCKELGIPFWKAKYALLGDDIVMGDRDLAKMYQHVMSDLGVHFSPLKSHDSQTLFEFAKRLYYKGEEITPFPISALKESQKRYYLLVNLLRELREKDWITIKTIPETIVWYYVQVVSKTNKRVLNVKFLSKIQENSDTCNLVMSMTRKEITADEVLRTIERNYLQTDRVVDVILADGGSCEGVLSSLAVESFADSQERFSKKSGLGLGDFALNLTIFFTGFTDDHSIGTLHEHLHFIPILWAHGLVSENYMNVQKEAFRIDTEGGGDWPFLLRTMVVPLDDRVYVERQSHLISRASAIIASKIKDRLKLIEMMYFSNSF